MNWGDLDLGNLPEWLSAIFTAFAFGVTLYLLNGEIRARRMAEQDRLEDDARRVSAWWTKPHPTPKARWGNRPSIRPGAPASDSWEFEVCVRNAGENAIRDCIVYFGPTRIRGVAIPDSDAQDIHFPIVPSGETMTHRMSTEFFILEPQDHEPDDHGFYRGPFVEIVFTDSQGRHWRRDRKGQLLRRKNQSVES